MGEELKNIVSELITGKYSVSQAIEMGICELYNEPDSDLKQWLNLEIKGYDGKDSIPAYRKIDCSVVVQLYDSFGKESERIVDVSHIDKWLQMHNIGLSMSKMYISQGIKSLEDTIFTNKGGFIDMAIPQNIIRDMADCYKMHGAVITGFYQRAPLEYVRSLIDAVRNKFVYDVFNYHSTISPQKPQSIYGGSKMTINDITSLPNDKTILFVSYSWDNDEHKKWVLNFVDKIDATEKFYVIFDQRMKKGFSVSRFMDAAIKKSDYVLVIGTPTYLTKFESGHGGVSYEGTIITNELLHDIDSGKFIPILRKGTRKLAFPPVVADINGFDLSGNNCIGDVVNELVEDFSK